MNFKKFLVVGIGAALLVGGCSSDTGSSDKAEKTKEEIPAKKEEKKIYQLGDTIKVLTFDDEHYYNLTFDSVTLTDNRSEYEDASEHPKKVILISYNYENVDSPDPIYVDAEYNFIVADSEGNTLEKYDLDDGVDGESVPAGVKSKNHNAFILENDSKEVTIYVNNSSNDIIAEVKAEIK